MNLKDLKISFNFSSLRHDFFILTNRLILETFPVIDFHIVFIFSYHKIACGIEIGFGMTFFQQLIFLMIVYVF